MVVVVEVIESAAEARRGRKARLVTVGTGPYTDITKKSFKKNSLKLSPKKSDNLGKY
jgi:hypothetical protein